MYVYLQHTLSQLHHISNSENLYSLTLCLENELIYAQVFSCLWTGESPVQSVHPWGPEDIYSSWLGALQSSVKHTERGQTMTHIKSRVLNPKPDKGKLPITADLCSLYQRENQVHKHAFKEWKKWIKTGFIYWLQKLRNKKSLHCIRYTDSGCAVFRIFFHSEH